MGVTVGVGVKVRVDVGVEVAVVVKVTDTGNSFEAVKVFPKDMAVSANSACVF